MRDKSRKSVGQLSAEELFGPVDYLGAWEWIIDELEAGNAPGGREWPAGLLPGLSEDLRTDLLSVRVWRERIPQESEALAQSDREALERLIPGLIDRLHGAAVPQSKEEAAG